MKLDIVKTKEFKIKLGVSIILLILFSLSFLFAENLKSSFGLGFDFLENEVAVSKINESDYKVHYLDVGQGNSSVIEFPDGKVMVIDGGSDMYGEKIYDFLESKNISKIDYMIATHSDSDHIGGLNFLFDKLEIVKIFRPMQIAGYEIEEISSNGTVSSHFQIYEYEDLKSAYKTYGSSAFIETTSQRYREFIKNVYTETYTIDDTIFNSEITVFYDGLKIIGEGYEFEFFAPLKSEMNVNLSNLSNTNGFLTKIYNDDNSNNSSAIFLVNIMGDKYFFSGDASSIRGENDKEDKFEESDFLNSLISEDIVKLSSVDVYLVAHHGSKYSSSAKLLDLIKAEFAIISVGENNYGHPSEEVLARLTDMGTLSDDGLIFTSEAGNISFSSVNGEVCYAKEISTKKLALMIPFEMLLLVIFVLIESIIINIKPPRKNLTDN